MKDQSITDPEPPIISDTVVIPIRSNNEPTLPNQKTIVKKVEQVPERTADAMFTDRMITEFGATKIDLPGIQGNVEQEHIQVLSVSACIKELREYGDTLASDISNPFEYIKSKYPFIIRKDSMALLIEACELINDSINRLVRRIDNPVNTLGSLL